MSRTIKSTLALVLVGLLAISQLGVALAKNDKQIREEYAGSLTGIDVCGLIVDGEFAGTFHANIKNWVVGDASQANNIWLGVYHNKGSVTWTNPLNGKSVVESWNNNFNDASVVDHGDGTYSLTFSVSGQPVRLNGKPLDRGTIVLTDTFYLGDLTTEADDYFISQTAGHIGGPHPVFGTDYYCELFVPLMS